MNNNYDLNNGNRIGEEGDNNFAGSVNNDFANNQNNNPNNLGNYNQTPQNSLGSNGNSVVSQESNVNSDLVNNQSNNPNNLGNYNQTPQNSLGSNGNSVVSQESNVNSDFANNQNNNTNNLGNYNQTPQNSLGSNENGVVSQESNVNSDLVNNQSNDTQMPQNSLSNDGNSENMVYNSSAVNSDVNLKVGKKKNKTGFIVAMIVIAVVLISFGVKILIPIVATKQVSSTISTVKLNSIIDEYKIIEKNVKMFAYAEQTVTCNSDCYELYGYDKKNFDIKVTDKDTYYQIELKAIGETYKGANLDSDKCNGLSNATCNGNGITGKVYKISE